MKPEITTIGTGALGTTLARALHKNGYFIKSVFNRTVSEAEKLAGQLGAELTGSFPASVEETGALVFIAISDDAIREAAFKLSDKIVDFSGKTVVHCSGNETSAILDPLKKRKAITAAFHPLQTFHKNSGPDSFSDIYISLEGDEKAVHLLSGIADRLGSKALPITPGAKPYLHAAAVMASNYLVALMEAAGEISELGGIEQQQARKALMPLAKTALENTSASDLSAVLSGPVARGDVSTVEKHLKLLEHNPELLSLYKTLGLQTLKLARKNNRLTVEESEELKKCFQDNARQTARRFL